MGLTSTPKADPEVLLGSRPSARGMVGVSLQHVPVRERSARFRDFFDNLGVRYEAKHRSDEPVEIDITVQGLPGIQLRSGRMRGGYWRRTRMDSDPTEDVGLLINPRGRLLAAQNGRDLVLDDGEATLVSLTDPLESSHRMPGDILVLRVPKFRIAPLLTGSQDGILRRIPCQTPALQLLTGYIGAGWRQDGIVDGDLQRLFVSHLYDLIAMTIGPTPDASEAARCGGWRAARLSAVKHDIETRLDRSDLSIAGIAARHHCTQRSLQRLFEEEGTTFTDYLLERRLARAHGMLVDPGNDEAKISSIACDSGFGDTSYFNRAFRRAYGVTPSDVRAQARSNGRRWPKS